MVKMIFPKLETRNSRAAYVCKLGSTPLVKLSNVLSFKKFFGHFSCDTNLIKTYRPNGLGYMRCATMIRKRFFYKGIASCLMLGIIQKTIIMHLSQNRGMRINTCHLCT